MDLMLNDKIDEFEALLAEHPPVDCQLEHTFTPGLYSRSIFMPKGTWVTSKIHKTTHPFIVSQGKVSVYSENDGEQLIEAPYMGITKPGTRRILFIHESVIWTTFHVLAKEDETLEEIEERIIEKHENLLINKNNIEWHG